MAPRFARNHNDGDGCRACVDSQATRQLQARHGTSAMPFSNDDVRRPCDRDLVRQDGCRSIDQATSQCPQRARVRRSLVDRVVDQQN